MVTVEPCFHGTLPRDEADELLILIAVAERMDAVVGLYRQVRPGKKVVTRIRAAVPCFPEEKQLAPDHAHVHPSDVQPFLQDAESGPGDMQLRERTGLPVHVEEYVVARVVQQVQEDLQLVKAAVGDYEEGVFQNTLKTIIVIFFCNILSNNALALYLLREGFASSHYTNISD